MILHLGKLSSLVFYIKEESEGAERGKHVLANSPSPPTLGSRISPEAPEGTETEGDRATSQVLQCEPELRGTQLLLPWPQVDPGCSGAHGDQ